MTWNVPAGMSAAEIPKASVRFGLYDEVLSGRISGTIML